MRFVLLVVSIVLLIITAVICFGNHFSLRNEITDVKHRAQVSADAEEIHDRLVELDQRMEERGMTYGYAARFVRSPWTSMEEIRENVQTLIARTELVSTLDHTSDAYQQGLDDIRGTLRELDLQVWGWWVWNEGGWIWLYLILPLFGIGLFVSIVWIVIES